MCCLLACGNCKCCCCCCCSGNGHGGLVKYLLKSQVTWSNVKCWCTKHVQVQVDLSPECNYHTQLPLPSPVYNNDGTNSHHSRHIPTNTTLGQQTGDWMDRSSRCRCVLSSMYVFSFFFFFCTLLMSDELNITAILESNKMDDKKRPKRRMMTLGPQVSFFFFFSLFF